ncbi:NAD(P)H-hydrate epimerase [Tistlia consotensis]|uniref:Bifunctional NAD(P)H-hydrate repair enzyme n=1 Tax=Tistlia consotensis USBA 355 TaxID=560819 RepID=A0A1Y6BRG6_9PROT|nr:NAD(P)H-hydrate dehydratase [Tistlia consotensis]SMF24430.1 NAD(P)H-hydrate epimerase [Tistlia consotensis USBA 355]SNR60538.1 NAD(P)H-hydrate epimerase [Tistlia consotensis]
MIEEAKGAAPVAPEALLLSVAEMAAADRAAMARGVAGTELMEQAGRAVELAIRARWSARPTLVLCGPGNNGGDGFVAARRLQAAGWPVRLALLGTGDGLTGDAAHHAALWEGPVEALAPAGLAGAELIVDALFGAGLSRPLEGAAAATVEAANAAAVPLVAVDVPSGLSGDTGAPLGPLAAEAALTVTFFRKKPGHLLYPGRRLCGEIRLADIGIPDSVLPELALKAWQNGPALWRSAFPRRRPESHKYDYGHAVVAGGPMTGAARLAALAALRVGAGLVSIAARPEDRVIYALASPSLIVRDCAEPAAWEALIEDERLNALVVGPGLGRGDTAWQLAHAALATGRATVLDADAVTAAEGRGHALFRAVRGPVVLTPHDGEFRRLFPDLEGDRLVRARRAAERSGCVVLLKGADGVVAAPDGRAAITVNAPPALATAGTGDVLAGTIGGLLAQGMPAFEAAAAGAWLQGEAAALAGAGMISQDLPERISQVLRGAAFS